MSALFASAPDEDGVVWVENDHGVVGVMSSEEAQSLAHALLACADIAEGRPAVTPNPLVDATALDRIALLLGTTGDWSSDHIEWVADVVGEVRGGKRMVDSDRETALAWFTKQRGFDPREVPALRNYVGDPDESVGGPR